MSLAASDAGFAGGYRQTVIVAIGIAGVLVFIVTGLVWTARLVHIGNLDAQALADKTAVPSPVSAVDWPELRLRSVIAQPGGPPPLVLLRVGWPAYPRREATLLVAVGRDDQAALLLLSQWCAAAASVSPVLRYGAELELRRRQSLERVHAVLIAEDGPVDLD